MHLKDKVAIVTGGAQGIGRAVATLFIEHGARVVLADVDREAGEETAVALLPGGQASFIPCDVSGEEDVERLIRQTVEIFGRLDMLINNAGIFIENYTPVTELSLEDWNRVIGVNLTGMFLCAKYAVPHLRRNKGTIVNIASTRALMSEKNTEAYSASKGGIVALTHDLAISLGPDIRVNCISPGWIETGDWKKSSARHEVRLRPEDHAQHPAGRVGRPEDIAALAAFLVSEEASFITGANIVADGGMTRKMIYI